MIVSFSVQFFVVVVTFLYVRARVISCVIAKVPRDCSDIAIHLVRYEAAMRTLQEVITAMQAGHWEDALLLYTSAREAWQEQRMTHDLRYHTARIHPEVLKSSLRAPRQRHAC